MGMSFNERWKDTPYGVLDVGDTFKAPDNRYYIKIPKVVKCNVDLSEGGPYNCICLATGEMKFITAEQPICKVQLEADVIMS